MVLRMHFLTKQNKKYWSKMKRLRLAGWHEESSDSQVGQLLYYLTAVQLKMIQTAFPSPVLGLFMEEGKVNMIGGAGASPPSRTTGARAIYICMYTCVGRT